MKALVIEVFLKGVPPLSPEFYSKPLGPRLQALMLCPHAHWLHSLCLANREGPMRSTVGCILISEKLKLWKTVHLRINYFLWDFNNKYNFIFQNVVLQGISPWRSCRDYLGESMKRTLKHKYGRQNSSQWVKL